MRMQVSSISRIFRRSLFNLRRRMGVDLTIARVMDSQCTGAEHTRGLVDSCILLRDSIRFFPRRIPGVSYPRRDDTFVLG